MRIAELFSAVQLNQQANMKKPPMGQNDQSDFQGPNAGNGPVNTNKQPSGQQGTMQQGPQPGGMQQSEMNPNQSQQSNPDLAAAPYVTLLTKLGYEYQGQDEDVNGNPIGNSFQGQDGDMILAKPDGSWVRFGPGAQRAQGPDIATMGQNLVRNAIQQGDDQNPNSALRQAGYQKIHQDPMGNSYYKHPQTGKTVTVQKDGKWGSSVGTGRGAHKLRDFLGNEQMQDQDPQMQKMKLQQQQMKQQGMQQQGGMKQPGGTRGSTGTRTPRQGGGKF